MSSDQSDKLCFRHKGSRTCDIMTIKSLIHMTKEKRDGGISISRSQGASSHQQWLSLGKGGLPSVPGKGHHVLTQHLVPGVPLPGTLSPLLSSTRHPASPHPCPAVSLLAPHLFPSESLSKPMSICSICLVSFFIYLLVSPTRGHTGERWKCVLFVPLLFSQSLCHPCRVTTWPSIINTFNGGLQRLAR